MSHWKYPLFSHYFTYFQAIFKLILQVYACIVCWLVILETPDKQTFNELGFEEGFQGKKND